MNDPHPSDMLTSRRQSCRKQRGFTLVELLVVMVILGLLAALVVPAYLGRERKARSQAARTQIELLGTFVNAREAASCQRAAGG